MTIRVDIDGNDGTRDETVGIFSYQRKKGKDQNKKYIFSSKAVTWRKKMGQSADQKDRPRTWKM